MLPGSSSRQGILHTGKKQDRKVERTRMMYGRTASKKRFRQVCSTFDLPTRTPANLGLLALRLFAGRGRTKKDLNGKQSGGNEFISDYILKKTGTFRSRKQVSSHIQVLKSFLQDVPSCMSRDLTLVWMIALLIYIHRDEPRHRLAGRKQERWCQAKSGSLR